ncbi:cation diffusion facilitator family transporter [Frigidibacter sp. ROC022]|uniref:cation diffusion facilitator family transporter n=1 Tax=Frigidibacter sp. ROC022 TaxID=2971796 RepID=UPI00215A2BB4|nr:cation diffusion facilitator family transporter [Frigidibacter sp. ROC022]MCR8723740.1 cation diffusion facilitator family transporter [Frigidibacter sp. ROC022]
MAAGESTRVVIVAFLGNALIAASKLGAAAFTGSSAMFAEGVHSIVDSGNQLLLLHGMKQSKRPADRKHPFGYGKEVYFWSFVVAILLFSIGSGVSLYHGVEKILHPHPVENPYVNFVVIGLAVIFEGYALRAAVVEMNRRRQDESVLHYVRRSKDAPLVVVLLEDTGALIGLATAALALLGAQIFGIPELDGLASVLIGILLAAAAIILAVETKGLLIGEAAEPHVQAGIEAILKSDARILAINEILTMHMGPEDIFCALSVDFKDGESSIDVEASISDLEATIKDAFPAIKRVFIEAQSVSGHRRSQRAAAQAAGS